MFMVQGPALGLTGQLDFAHALQGVEQLLDRRLAQLGIGRVRHLALGDHFNPQRAFRRQRQLVLRRLAVDEELRAARLLVGDLRSLAVALFADQKQQSNVNAIRLSASRPLQSAPR